MLIHRIPDTAPAATQVGDTLLDCGKIFGGLQ